MLIELKNVPQYDRNYASKIEKLSFSSIGKFESVDLSLKQKFCDKTGDRIYVCAIDIENGKAHFITTSEEKQMAFYNVIRDALVNKLDFLSVDFEDWK